jgi:Ala-tRNA(Pro) deacylase
MPAEREQQVYDFLQQMEISYVRHEHPPVFTVEEADQYWEGIAGAHSKNLFLRNNKGNQHFLVVLESSKKVDLNQLGEKTGAGKLSFASADRLEKYLGLEKGAVSPFGLINDHTRVVRVVLDEELKKSEYVNFHPNVNTATLTLSFQDFERFLDRCGNEVSYL